jgi:hypothetical protein
VAAADPEAAQDNLRNAGKFDSGGSKNFRCQRIATLGRAEHNGEQVGEIGDRRAMASLHKVLAGDYAPVLHDAGDETAAAAHVQRAQALRNRTLADPMSRSFIGNHAAPSAGSRAFAALIAAIGHGAGTTDADHSAPARKGGFESNGRIWNYLNGGARKKLGEKASNLCGNLGCGGSGDSGADAGD